MRIALYEDMKKHIFVFGALIASVEPTLDYSTINEFDRQIENLTPAINSLSDQLNESFKKLDAACTAHQDQVREVYKKEREIFEEEMGQLKRLFNYGAGNVRLKYLESPDHNRPTEEYVEAVRTLLADEKVQAVMRKMAANGFVFEGNFLPLTKGKVDETIWNGYYSLFEKDRPNMRPMVMISKQVFAPMKGSFQDGLAFEARFAIGSSEKDELNLYKKTTKQLTAGHGAEYRNYSENFADKRCTDWLFNRLGESASKLADLKKALPQNVQKSSDAESKASDENAVSDGDNSATGQQAR
jgi:hypothetical protein